MNSVSTREPSAHVATVKRMLENHAGYLMANKMLRELVAFVKGTQFDLTVHSIQHLKDGYGASYL
jgi:hypothetical protein